MQTQPPVILDATYACDISCKACCSDALMPSPLLSWSWVTHPFMAGIVKGTSWLLTVVQEVPGFSSPFIETIIEVIGIASTGYDLHHSQAKQGDYVEKQGSTLAPGAHQPSNHLMILNDVIPAHSWPKIVGMHANVKQRQCRHHKGES